MLKIGRHHQAFVGNYAIREAANVKIRLSCQRRLDTTPNHKQSSGHLFMGCIVSFEEDLLNGGQLLECDLAADIRLCRHDPPCGH